MPDQYMSAGVVTAGLSSADSCCHPELKIRRSLAGQRQRWGVLRAECWENDRLTGQPLPPR